METLGKEVLLLFLGDPVYPSMPWLMKFHQNTGHLTSEQKQFNFRLSKARVVVEHYTYCRLKGLWQCLLNSGVAGCSVWWGLIVIT